MEENLKNPNMSETEAGIPDAESEKNDGIRKNPKQVTISNEMHTEAFRESQAVTIDRAYGGNPENGKKEIAWHDLKDSMIRHKILTGRLMALERPDIGGGEHVNIAVADYSGYRIVIPISEMNIIVKGTPEEVRSRQVKITSNMIGSEIDFIVTHIDESSYSVVASRKQAMKRKVRDFFVDPVLATGKPVINIGSVVQARVMAVSDTVLRLEIFGIECFAPVYEISAAWVADARKRYDVGDRIYVRVTKINVPEGEMPSIEVEGKSLSAEKPYVCQKQGKYFGTVTGFHEGVYFLRLDVGTNALAHAVKGSSIPKKEDHVAFVCTRMDEESNVAVGMITRVVRSSR